MININPEDTSLYVKPVKFIKSNGPADINGRSYYIFIGVYIVVLEDGAAAYKTVAELIPTDVDMVSKSEYFHDNENDCNDNIQDVLSKFDKIEVTALYLNKLMTKEQEKEHLTRFLNEKR
jgi:hypothetical protein